MDFTPTETEQAVRGVAADALEKGGGTWTALASAGLLGLAVPEQHGGDGLGLLEVGVLLPIPNQSQPLSRMRAATPTARDIRIVTFVV